MNKTSIKWASIVAGLVAAGTLVPSAQAQSVDSLLDKLVDKGVLTANEAKELKDEADKDFNKAYSVKSGLPDWVTTLKLGGDLRARYEGFYADAPFIDRHRPRFRLRFGATALMMDRFEAGLRLSSSEPATGGGNGGDPISGNTTFQDNASRKFIYIDLAYGRWQALNTPAVGLSLTAGKMENPFVYTDMVFDHDYNPEGVAAQFNFPASDLHALKLNAAGFMIDEIGGNAQDPYMLGAQIRLESKWTPHLQSSFGVGALLLANKENLGASPTFGVTSTGGIVTNFTWTVPNQNGGNTRVGNSLQANFNPLVADGYFTFNLDKAPMYKGTFPIRIGGEYMVNPATDLPNTGWNAGVTFGKAGKKGTYEVGYRYKHLESDVWYEEVVDSDFGARFGSAYTSGTNVKGHILKAAFSPADAWTVGLTWFRTDSISSTTDGTMNRVQLDAVWKF